MLLAQPPDETAVLRISRPALRDQPPAVHFLPRDIRLPQL
jgi:hypothetical protein